MRIVDDDNQYRVSPRKRRVKPITRIERIRKLRRKRNSNNPHSSEKEERHFAKREDETIRHFSELEIEVEHLQEELDKNNRPFVVKIRREPPNVFIDIFRRTSGGTIPGSPMKTVDITKEDFTDWAKIIQEGEGMMINLEG